MCVFLLSSFFLHYWKPFLICAFIQNEGSRFESGSMVAVCCCCCCCCTIKKAEKKSLTITNLSTLRHKLHTQTHVQYNSSRKSEMYKGRNARTHTHASHPFSQQTATVCAIWWKRKIISMFSWVVSTILVSLKDNHTKGKWYGEAKMCTNSNSDLKIDNSSFSIYQNELEIFFSFCVCVDFACFAFNSNTRWKEADEVKKNWCRKMCKMKHQDLSAIQFTFWYLK